MFPSAYLGGDDQGSVPLSEEDLQKREHPHQQNLDDYGMQHVRQASSPRHLPPRNVQQSQPTALAVSSSPSKPRAKFTEVSRGEERKMRAGHEAMKLCEYPGEASEERGDELSRLCALIGSTMYKGDS